MSKRTKRAKPLKSAFPAIRLVSVKSESRVEHIDGDSWSGQCGGATIIFPAEVTIETEPKMSMEGVGSVVINGTMFYKPFKL